MLHCHCHAPRRWADKTFRGGFLTVDVANTGLVIVLLVILGNDDDIIAQMIVDMVSRHLLTAEFCKHAVICQLTLDTGNFAVNMTGIRFCQNIPENTKFRVVDTLRVFSLPSRKSMLQVKRSLAWCWRAGEGRARH